MRIIVDRGSNIGAIAAYLHRPEKRENGKELDDPVFHTNLFGRTAIDRAAEFRFSADLNPRVKNTYVHYKLSFPPGENPDLGTKKGIVDDVLAARGHGNHCQFLAIEHFDKIDPHDVHHFHILAAAVRLDGTWVDDKFERLKLKQVERAIEHKWGLQDGSPKPKGERNSDPIRDWKLREKLQAEGKTLIKDQVRDAIHHAATDQPTMPLFVARLKTQGIAVQVHAFPDGAKGISYAAEDRAFQGRRLGHRYTFLGLQQYLGVEYQSDRDDPVLRELNQVTTEHCQVWLNNLQRSRHSEHRQSQPEQPMSSSPSTSERKLKHQKHRTPDVEY
jgi:hypothetical protein